MLFRSLGSDTRLSDARSASDVYTWAKASTKPSYSYSEISSTPSSLPASDVYAWAKESTKPSYSASEVGALGASSQAVDSDKLDGYHSSAFATSGHNHDSAYSAVGHNHDSAYLGISGQAADSDKLDGVHALVTGTAGELASTIAKRDTAGKLYAVDHSTLSDARTKQNIATLVGALDKVLALRGVSFERLADPTQTTLIGLIAQETQAVVPEAINVDQNGTLFVSYGALVGVLVEAVKTLAARLAAVEAKLP